MSSTVDRHSIDAAAHLCFCADGKYVEFILPALESIRRSAKPGTVIAVDIIVDHHPSPEFCHALEHLCPGKTKVHVIDATQFGDLLEVTHISRGMYYRLLIPELVQADRVLYLDCDVLVRKDICSLFNLPMHGALAAAVVNPFYDASRLGLTQAELYFNSGVMLIDTRGWRESDVKAEVLAYLRQNNDLLQMPDQDALNVVLRGRWSELDPTFNCQVSMLVRHDELAQELAPRWSLYFLSDPAVMHFSAGHKQWHRSNRIKYSKEYRELDSHVMERRRGAVADFVIGRLRQIKYSILQSNPFFY
ncbi:lipopolysaccharide biosynthesis glycosyltransferase [Stenotrophomonas maltophilia]|uniref:glycosyltransferase family 8 protein n=1 Tax=Stenotrophomonas chelatiphaga TaxID=517011 RepID=UPI000F4BD0F4|nr:glycosyltransferase family 8 protein [Stenotrophomonas chelatiphaga]MCS4230399.1 lipopolysaccharide biosynthesis glycosyltransferase [Stenotrophomonas chelatiphaga]ROQ40329.1 lipopolysaccharide biosynthesis glycosyltransferase [Stenotrophomonas maltophilia]